MYRHFAVITIVCTSLLAMFADGEKTQIIAERAEQQGVERETQRAHQAGEAALVRQPGGSWGAEEAHSRASFSPPSSVSSMTSSFRGDFFGRQTPEALARLSSREREELLSAMAANGADGTGLARARSASLEADSRRRSGSMGLQ